MRTTDRFSKALRLHFSMPAVKVVRLVGIQEHVPVSLFTEGQYAV